ncbi:MAG: hypothetical protein RL127_1561 [Bacteroidota bacterium]
MKQIAFLINPQKQKELSSYVRWVINHTPACQISVFDCKWPETLLGFDQVWVMLLFAHRPI